MQTCNLPGSDDEEGRIRQGHVELGLGIHGEPGASVVDTQNSRAIIDTLVTPLKAQAGDGRFAVLINNLGGVSALEMALLTKELAHSALKENIAYLIGPAPLVSALDMKGFFANAVKAQRFLREGDSRRGRDAGLAEARRVRALRTVPHSALHDRVEYTSSDNPQVSEAVASVTKTLIQLENRLNALDAKVGDGDTGSTLRKGRGILRSDLRRTTCP